MKLYCWNVNGIRAVVKKGTFQKFIAEHKPDVLCLQETKAEKGQAEIDLPDYHEYWNSAEKKGYSGTAIFSKQEPIKVINGFPDSFAKKFTFADELKRDSWNEGRVITAEYEKFHVVTVYTPNAMSCPPAKARNTLGAGALGSRLSQNVAGVFIHKSTHSLSVKLHHRCP
jgi:exodeoxyribonuclease-3